MSEVHTYEHCPECQAVRGTVEIQGRETRVSIPKACKDFEGCRAGRPLLADEMTAQELVLSDMAPNAKAEAPLATCIAVGCDQEIPSNRDWCARHYALIPEKLKPPIWHAKSEREKALALLDAKAAVEKIEFGDRLL